LTNFTSNNSTNYTIVPVQSISSPYRFCWTGYFQNSISSNYGLWFGIIVAISYFMFTLAFEEIPYEKDYALDHWSHHPLYSIFKIRNNLFTGKSRMTLLWMNIITIGFTASILWNNVFTEGGFGNILAGAGISLVSGIVWCYI